MWQQYLLRMKKSGKYCEAAVVYRCGRSDGKPSFSTPHVQNLFGDPSYRYYWVVSLSRAVELTSNGTSTLGVLLVDMNYNSIEQILKKRMLEILRSMFT